MFKYTERESPPKPDCIFLGYGEASTNYMFMLGSRCFGAGFDTATDIETPSLGEYLLYLARWGGFPPQPEDGEAAR